MTINVKTPPDEISLNELLTRSVEWLQYLKSHWLIIIIAAFVSSGIGFLNASKRPITFSAKTTFVVEDGKGGASGLGGLASLAGQFGVDVGGGNGIGLFSGDNILLYFKSPSLSRDVLLTKYDSNSNETFADVYSKVYNLKSSWQANKSIGDVEFTPKFVNQRYSRLQDSLLLGIVDNIIRTQFIVTKTDKKAGFIDVITTMEDELLAKKYNEKIVQLAVQKYIDIKTQRQKNTIEKLQHRVDSIASLLQQKTVSSTLLQNSSYTMDLNPLYKTGNNVAVETTTRDKAMLNTLFVSLTQNLEMAKFALSQETPVIQIVDAPILPLKKNKTSRLKMTILYGLVSVFGMVCLLIGRKLIWQD